MGYKLTEILNQRLKDENLSKLSRDLSIPKTLLHEWVLGSRTPSLKNIQHVKALADHLGLSLEEILIGDSTSKIITSISFEDEGRNYKLKIEKI